MQVPHDLPRRKGTLDILLIFQRCQVVHIVQNFKFWMLLRFCKIQYIQVSAADIDTDEAWKSKKVQSELLWYVGFICKWKSPKEMSQSELEAACEIMGDCQSETGRVLDSFEGDATSARPVQAACIAAGSIQRLKEKGKLHANRDVTKKLVCIITVLIRCFSLTYSNAFAERNYVQLPEMVWHEQWSCLPEVLLCYYMLYMLWLARLCFHACTRQCHQQQMLSDRHNCHYLYGFVQIAGCGRALRTHAESLTHDIWLQSHLQSRQRWAQFPYLMSQTRWSLLWECFHLWEWCLRRIVSSRADKASVTWYCCQSHDLMLLWNFLSVPKISKDTATQLGKLSTQHLHNSFLPLSLQAWLRSN